MNILNIVRNYKKDEIPPEPKPEVYFFISDYEDFYYDFHIPYMIAHFDDIRPIVVDVNGEEHEIDLFNEKLLKNEFNEAANVFNDALHLTPRS